MMLCTVISLKKLMLLIMGLMTEKAYQSEQYFFLLLVVLTVQSNSQVQHFVIVENLYGFCQFYKLLKFLSMKVCIYSKLQKFF